VAKKYVPTEAHRELVKAMTAIGTPQDDIALCVGLTGKTLRKHYADEIKLGMIRANAAVGAGNCRDLLGQDAHGLERAGAGHRANG
jgi:hypothetical protein